MTAQKMSDIAATTYATIYKYDSKYFRYKIGWTSSEYVYKSCLFFDTKDECIKFVEDAFGKIIIYDHTEE